MKPKIFIFIVGVLMFHSCNSNNFMEADVQESPMSTDAVPVPPTPIDTMPPSTPKDTVTPPYNPNEDIIDPIDEPAGGDPINKSFTFIYKGKTYHTLPTIEDTIMFTDEQTRLLYEEIQKNPTLCTYVRTDGIIEFFDDFGSFLSRPAENIKIQPYEPLTESPKTTYEFTLHLSNLDTFTTKGVIVNNKDIYQDKHDFSTIENGYYFKKGVSFTFSMINEKNSTSDVTPKWPVQYKFWLVFFDKETFLGKTIAYNPNIHYSLGKKLQIEQTLSNINWHNRIACVLIMMTPF
jgi:hypothetical protein